MKIKTFFLEFKARGATSYALILATVDLNWWIDRRIKNSGKKEKKSRREYERERKSKPKKERFRERKKETRRTNERKTMRDQEVWWE